MKKHMFMAWMLLATVGWNLVSAADRAFVGKLAIAVSEDGVKRLELTAETKQKLLDLIDKREREALSLALELKDLPPEQRDARLGPFVADSERQGLALLTVEQRSRLDQLRIAQDGMIALGESDLAKVLGLSEDQQKQIQAMLAERRTAMTLGGENERRVTRNEYERKLSGLLSVEQRSTWEKLAGLADATKPSNTSTQSKTPMPAPAAVAQSTPKSAPSTIQKVDAPKQPAVEEATIAAEPARSEDGELLLKFTFQHAPWKDVLEWFAEQAELSLQMETPPPGTFNYRDSRMFTPAEGIDLMNSVLLTKGFTLVRHERVLALLNVEDPIPPQLVELVPLSELNRRGDFELIKCLFPLTKLEAAEAEAEISRLIGPQGSIVSLPKSKQLLVTETAGRLRTIREVISSVENPQSGHSEGIRQVSLKHVGVEEFLAIARPLLGLAEGMNSSADVRLSLDPFSPRIFAVGIPDALKRLEEIVTMVDKPTSGDATAATSKPLEQAQLETYQIGKADPTMTLQVLQSLLAGLPDVRLAVDVETKKLIALARPSEHRTIVETLRQLEGNADQIEVIQLRRMDPQLVILSINKMFGAGNEKDKAADAPKVDGDPTTMKLWVRGSREQIAQIRDLVEKLEGPIAGEGATARQPLRFMPLPGGSSRSTLETLEALWPQLRTNKLRVVTPSAISPTLREQTSSGSAPTERPTSDSATPPELQLPPGYQLRVIPNGPPAPAVPAPETEKKAVAPATVAPTKDARNAIRDSRMQVTARNAKSPSFHFVSFNADDTPAGETPPAEVAKPAAPKKEVDATEKPAAAVTTAPAAVPATGDQPEILITVTPQGIFIASKDLEALDDFEKLMRSVVEQRGALASGEPTIFWLKFAKADVVAELLNQILTGAGADSGGGGGGSLLGDMASSMLGDAGGLLGGLLGGGGGGGASAAAGSTTIVPDVRLNCLIVQGRPQDLMLIEQLLPVIDREASPEEVLIAGKPRLIPVIYMSAEEMAGIVKQVFAERVAGSGGSNQQRQPSPEEFINALRGRGGSSRNQSRGETAKMTVGIDSRSNSLIVAASEPLFREVEQLVRQLDQEGSETDDALQVVTLKSSNPQLLQKALQSITGGQIKANTSSAATTTGGTNSNTSQPSTTTSSSTPGQPSPDDIRRRIEFFQNMQRGGGFPGGGFPGGGGFSGGGSFPGGGFSGRGGGGDRGGGGGDRGGGGGDRGGRGGRD